MYIYLFVIHLHAKVDPWLYGLSFGILMVLIRAEREYLNTYALEATPILRNYTVQHLLGHNSRWEHCKCIVKAILRCTKHRWMNTYRWHFWLHLFLNWSSTEHSNRSSWWTRGRKRWTSIGVGKCISLGGTMQTPNTILTVHLHVPWCPPGPYAYGKVFMRLSRRRKEMDRNSWMRPSKGRKISEDWRGVWTEWQENTKEWRSTSKRKQVQEE